MMRGRQIRPDGRLSRFGLTTAETIAVIASIGLVSITAFLASPFVLKAGSGTENPSIPRAQWPENLVNAVDGLDTLIQHTRATLYVDDHSTPERHAVEFVVLWGADNRNRGRINRSEIVVIRHSRLLSSVSVYIHEPGEFDGSDPIIEASSFDQSFIDDFMSRRDTVQRVIGIDIESMTLLSNGSSDHSDQSIPENSAGRIQLTCPSHSADTLVAASVAAALPSWYEPR